jgi:hypothetical protein
LKRVASGGGNLRLVGRHREVVAASPYKMFSSRHQVFKTRRSHRYKKSNYLLFVFNLGSLHAIRAFTAVANADPAPQAR